MKKTLSILSLAMILVAFMATPSITAKQKKWRISINLHHVKIKTVPETDVKMVSATKNKFANDTIDIRWQPKPQGFKLQLANTSGSPISIIWEKSFFTDTEKKNHKLAHAKVKLAENMKPIPPTTIKAKGKLKTALFPLSYAYQDVVTETIVPFNTGATSQYEKKVWKKRDIYRQTVSLNEMQEEDSLFDISAYLEKSVYNMVLVIKRENTLYEYIFHFKSSTK